MRSQQLSMRDKIAVWQLYMVVMKCGLSALLIVHWSSLCCCYDFDTETINRYHKHSNSSLFKNEDHLYISPFSQLSKKTKVHFEYAKDDLKNDSNFAARVKSSHHEKSDTQIETNNNSSPLNAIDLLNEAKDIAFRLKNIVNAELFVPEMQKIFDTSTFVDVDLDYESQLNQMVDKMESKLKNYGSILDSIGNRIHDLYKDYLVNGGLFSVQPCCSQYLSNLEFDKHFGTRISRKSSCSITPFPLTKGAFNPGRNLTQEFYDNLAKYPTIKWQYFISAWGVFAEYPSYHNDALCNWNLDALNPAFKVIGSKKSTNYDENEIGLSNDDVSIRHRDVYLSTVLSTPKYVMLVIDHGSALSVHQLNIAKAVAKQILNSLSYQDKVGLIALSNEVQYPSSDSCVSHQMALANYETKYHFSRFIETLQKISDSTNHILGLNRAFEIIRNTLNTVNATSSATQTPEVLIVYISRGLLTSLTDAKSIMELISSEISEAKYRLIINSYAPIHENKPVLYETAFLKDIANQNFKKYKVKSPEKSKIRAGIMIALNSTEHLSFIIKGVYSVLTKAPHTSTQYSLPYYNQFSKELDVSISKPVVHRSHLVGVAGVDVALADLAEDVINFSLTPHSYAFLVERTSGNVLVHPTFGRPSQAQEPLMHTDLSHLEQFNGFQRIRKLILREPRGIESVVINTHSSSFLRSKKFDGRITYYWRHINGSPYILCVVATSRRKGQHINAAPPKQPSFVYHRLDLTSNIHQCRNLKQLSSIETSALFLSPLSFYSAYRFTIENETAHIIQRFMAYLNDNTDLIANPGLKPAVRGDTLTISRITPFWKKEVASSNLTKYIVRRYIATPSGPFLVYPATVLDQRFDATRREWYIRAVEQPGRVVFTAPYLDSGGAGYIVTVSHAISRRRESRDEVAAVMGIDFTLGFFHKLLIELIPICSENLIKCFIMDDRGYLIAHPSLFEPTGRGPVEYNHVTNQEPLVANDILNHKHFVRKNVCNSFGDRTIQRFYQFNTSFNSLLTNFVTGDHCAKYNIAPLPGTNAFIGVVNQVCNSATAFCPCSMTDRLCLNCHRMEQTDCECPCECPLEMNLCTGRLFDEEDKNPTCLPYTEEVHDPPIDRIYLNSLPKCYDVDCSFFQSKSDCMGVLGCEWCHMSFDGVTPLAEKFCTVQSNCFRGVLGSRTPDAGEITDPILVETTRSTPVALVALSVIFCCILFASTFCYYRHRVQGVPQYFADIREHNLRMGNLDNENDEIEYLQEPSPNIAPNQILLAGFENAAIISPYRLNPGYRRPPGGDSDHGYSTMTPHEDSELAGPPFVEPLLLSREKLKTVPDSNRSVVSTSSRSSSPPLRQQESELQQTVLTKVPANGAHFLAQVQVHVVDAN